MLSLPFRLTRIRCAAVFLAIGCSTPLFADDPKPPAPKPESNLPKGALARLGSRTMRQIGSIGALLFTGDDSRLLTTGNVREVTSWDTATGQAVARFGIDSTQVIQLVIAPNESQLYAASMDGKIFRFQRGKFDKPEQLVVQGFNPVLSPTLDRIISIAQDGTSFDLFDIEGKPLRTIDSKGQKAVDADFSDDGKLLALSSWMIPEGESKANRVAIVRIVKVDATTADEEVKLIQAPFKATFKRVRFLSDDKRIVCAGNDGLLRVIDIEKNVIDPTIQVSNSAILAMEVSADGKLIAVGDSTGHITILDTVGFHVQVQFQTQIAAIMSVAFSKNGSMLAIGSSDSTIYVYDAQTGERRLGPSGHEGTVTAITCSSDASTIVTATTNGFLHVWDGHDYHEIKVNGVNTSSINAVAFSPTEGLIATASQDGHVSFYDAKTGIEVKRVVGLKNAALDCAFSPDGGLVYVAYVDNTIVAIDSHTGQPARTLEYKTQSSLFSVAVSRDGKKIAAGASSIRIFDETGKALTEIKSCKAPVNTMVFSPDGNRLIVGLADGSIRVYETTTGDEKQRVAAGPGRIRRLALSLDGTLLLSTTDSDSMARLFDADSLAPIATFAGHEDSVLCAAFLGSDRIVTGSADTTALVWSLPDHKSR